MKTSAEKSLAAALGGAPAVLAPFSAAVADGTPMSGGMMGNASTYGHMYGVGNAWLPALVVVATASQRTAQPGCSATRWWRAA